MRGASIPTALSTAVALLCFAGNSLLCRLALADAEIDPASFTALRLASGAAVLALLSARGPDLAPRRRTWIPALFLLGYAAPFSWAYVSLGAATGALILFASVQVTMLAWGVARGERPSALGWLGAATAVAGLVWLTAPGVDARDPTSAVVMAASGAAWGAYSVCGRGAGDPLRATASSFVRASILAGPALVLAMAFVQPHASSRGIALALASGAITSGVGYAVWYAALAGLTVTRAAVVQLLVPALAALGGVVLLGEQASPRLVLAGTLTLVGVALTVAPRPRSESRPVSPAGR